MFQSPSLLWNCSVLFVCGRESSKVRVNQWELTHHSPAVQRAAAEALPGHNGGRTEGGSCLQWMFKICFIHFQLKKYLTWQDRLIWVGAEPKAQVILVLPFVFWEVPWLRCSPCLAVGGSSSVKAGKPLLLSLGMGGNRAELWPAPALAYFHIQDFCGE